MDSQTIRPSPTETNIYTLLHNPTYHIKPKTRKKAMEKLQGLILKLAETHPNASLTPAAKTHVQNRLKQLFSQYKTPDHPPYSAMIERALQELNEKGGSSEDSISKFLEKEYNDVLPQAHSMFLKHHLGKLCESGDIVARLGKRYMLVGCKSRSKFKFRMSKQATSEEEINENGGRILKEI